MSKLTVHYNSAGNKTGFGSFLKTTFDAKSPVNIIYSVNGNIKDDIVRNSPTTKWVYRRQTETFNRLPNNFFRDNPEENAINWLIVETDPTDRNRTQVQNWLLNPADWYDPLNEPVPQTREEARYLNRWMIKALEIANLNGLKLAMFSFAFGTPEYGFWSELIPSLELGKRYGAILSLHEYSKDGPMMEAVDDEFVLRYRKVYNLLPESARLPLVISEASPDNGYGMGFSGQAWVNDMATYDVELMKDSYVLGACGYQLGGNESNLVDALPNLTEYVKTHPTKEDEDMKLNYVVVGYLAPQNATLEQVKLIQEAAFPTRSTVSQSADDVRALVSMGLPGSKAIIYEPNSWPGGIAGITQFFTGLSIEFRYFNANSVDFWVNSPILDIPFRVTDPFNTPRTYANGLHEGLDLDCYEDVHRTTVNIYAAQSGVVESVQPIYTGGENYGKYVVIRHDWYGQVFKTWYCHLSDVSVTRGQTVNIGTKIGVGGNTGTSLIHLHFMIQWIPNGLDGYFTPDVIDPLPLIRQNTSTHYLTNSGVGLATQALLTTKELSAITTSKVSTTLALTLPNYDDTRALVTQLKSRGQSVIGRLFFSANVGSRFTPQDFVDFCNEGTRGLYDSGVRVFQVHNEPNLPQEGYGWNWANGTEFGVWLKGVITILRSRYQDIQLVYPGLSPQPNTVQFFKDSKFAADLCDFVGVHSYWYTVQGGQWNMVDRSGGMSWKDIVDLTTKPIIITEYSNNNPNETYENKGTQYKQYIELLKQDGRVVSAYSFALSWPGQDVNKEGWVYNGNITAIPEKLGT